MKGYQITFFTIQGHRHKGKPIFDWLMHLVKELGMRGATLLAASEGIGKHGRLHSAHFFEFPDQPVEIVVAATEEESVRLFDRLQDENVHIFYVKSAVEFGTLGDKPE